MAVSRYRDRHTVSRKKSDAQDAAALANILRTDRHAHRPMPRDSELAQAIAVLARVQQDAVWKRQQQSNWIRSLLRKYYPSVLRAFLDSTDLAMPVARALLTTPPTPTKAVRLTRSQIRRILVEAGKTRNLEAAADDLHPVLGEPGLRQLPAVEAVFGTQFEALLLQFDAGRWFWISRTLTCSSVWMSGNPATLPWHGPGR